GGHRLDLAHRGALVDARGLRQGGVGPVAVAAVEVALAHERDEDRAFLSVDDGGVLHRPQDRVEAHRAPPLTWEGKGKPCALPVQVGTLIEDVLSVREELRFGRELQLPAFSMERAYIPSFWSLWVSGPVVLQRPLGGRHH